MNSTKMTPLGNFPNINTAPFASVLVDRMSVKVFFDDDRERRWSLTFGVVQAVKVTTADCFIWPPNHARGGSAAYVVQDSMWIEDLKESLSIVDASAKFLDKAMHFIFDMGDDVVEVVSWGFTIDQMGNHGQDHQSPISQ